MLGLSRRSVPLAEPIERANISMKELAIATITPGATLKASPSQALASSAVIACLDILCGAHSQTPIDVVRTVGAKRLPVEPQPLVIAKPSAMVTQDVWHTQVAFSIHTDGNAFAMVGATDRMGRPTQLETIDPDLVVKRRVEKGIPTVEIEKKDHQLWPHGDVWHVPGRLIQPGEPWGISPLKAAAEAIGIGLSAASFGGRFFRDAGIPPTVFTVTSTTTQDSITRMKTQFLDLMRGSREPIVMSGDVKVNSLSVDPDDSQFSETQQFMIEEVCRFFFVPPNLVFRAISGLNVTYANMTQTDASFLKYSLMVPMGRVERALSAILAPDLNVKFNLAAFTRADLPTRYASYVQALTAGWMTVDEVRALEDLPPLGGTT